MPGKRLVFISGPYSLGDVAMNVRNAILAADEVCKHAGLIAYVPHLSHFLKYIELAKKRLAGARTPLPGMAPGFTEDGAAE